MLSATHQLVGNQSTNFVKAWIFHLSILPDIEIFCQSLNAALYLIDNNAMRSYSFLVMSETLLEVSPMCDPSAPPLVIEKGTVLLAYRGSIAHGMHVPHSDPNSIDDVDLMSCVIGDLSNYFGLREWGSRGTKEAWQGHYDCVWYELRKAVSLLLQGNPNILSILWLRPSEYIHLEPEGKELLANRHLFVGKHVYNSFAGYAHAQLLKMETREPAEVREYLGVTYELKKRQIHPTDQILPDDLGDYTDCAEWSDDKLRQRYRSFTKRGENLGYLGDKRKKLLLQFGYDSKNAAHCVRLLRMCREFLATGEMTVYRVADAQELLDIKTGKWSLADVKALANGLFEDIRAARDASQLPPGPDRASVEALLVRLIRDYLDRTTASQPRSDPHCSIRQA